MSRKLNSLIMFKVQNCSIQHCSFTKRLQIRKLQVQPNFAPWWYGRSKTCFSGAFQNPGQLRQTSKELSGDFTALRTWDTTVGHRRTAKKACCVPACGFRVLNARETLLCKKNWWRKNPKKKSVRIPPPTATHTGSDFGGWVLCQPPFVEVTRRQGCPQALGESSLRHLKEEAASEPEVLQSLSQG